MKKLIILFFVLLISCSSKQRAQVTSDSGVTKATVNVEKGSDGLTTEQRNVASRLKMDNEAGSIKHLYIISAMSGDVIIYSTVNGKVTSSGKRLTPVSVNGYFNTNGYFIGGMPVNIGNYEYFTSEVLQDDGTYGSSIEYLFWWDSRGNYHQHYPSGGQIVHISDQPMNFPKIILNLEDQEKHIEVVEEQKIKK